MPGACSHQRMLFRCYFRNRDLKPGGWMYNECLLRPCFEDVEAHLVVCVRSLD
jgi:hypothetical protein